MTTPNGVGLGLRWEFVDELLERVPRSIDFLEVSPENYMGRGGYFSRALDRCRAEYPMLTHGLTMSLGGVEPIGEAYFEGLRAFLRSRRGAVALRSPVLRRGARRGPARPVAARVHRARALRVVDRVKRAQDALGRPMAVENISFYLRPGACEMSEAEFVALVCDRADCALMLDVNNAFVNATNFGFDVDAWMRTVPLDRVVQMHVAGHERFEEEGESVVVDTHGADVADPVLALLERVLPRTGRVPIVLERDQAIPSLDGLLAEIARVRAVVDRVFAKGEAPAARRRAS